MQVFSSTLHSLHTPPYSLVDGGIHLPFPENPERLERVLKYLRRCDWAKLTEPEDFGMEPILAVHDKGYADFLRTAFTRWTTEGGELGPEHISPIATPATFVPRRANPRPPRSFFGQLGYYGTDTNAPIVEGTFAAAVASAHCALSAAKAVLGGERAAFCASRPPGHHAGRDYAGGFCYLNNAAIAARWLSRKFRVAVLDIDFHAGNGTQDIFYESPEVLTVSIHGDPLDVYPNFMGYAEETGSGDGKGYHRNFPLPAGTDDRSYLETLSSALALVREFQPSALVISAGMDILDCDPLGNFNVSMKGIHDIGTAISALELPACIVMEGGYNHDTLGEAFVTFAECFREASSA